jgi:hypothetical protein
VPLTILLHVQQECQTVLDTIPPSQQTVAVTRTSLARWHDDIATARVLLSDPFAPGGALAFAAALVSALVGGGVIGWFVCR